VAVNCRVKALMTLGLAGVTVMELKVTAVTVKVVFPDTLPEAAVMTEVPAETPVARPPALTVATPVVPEDQIAEAVRFCEVPSE
jgi:hypothetical protein